MNHLETYRDSLDQRRVLVIGDSMLDRYIWGAVNRMSPEAPVPILLMDELQSKIGGAANVAANIVALGAQCDLLSVIGLDNAGRNFMEILDSIGIGGEHMILSSRKTTVKTRVIAGEEHLLRVDEEDTSDYAAPLGQRLINEIRSAIEQNGYDVVILQDYNKGLLAEIVIREILNLCHERQIRVCVDPKFQHFFSYQGVHIFKPNLLEINEMLDFEVTSDQQILDQADQILRKRLGHTYSVITLGADGIYVSDGEKSIIVPVRRRQIVDVCGAGDAVISAIGLTVDVELSLEELGRIGNAAGGLVCESVGVATIPKHDFLHEISVNQ